MPAPRDIIDALECVVSIYFSDIRHRIRAAFLLTDELVEMSCKAKAIAANPTLGKIQFYNLLQHPAVLLDPYSVPLGDVLNRSHLTRNSMQHGNAAFTVDDQHCADFILDAVAAMDHCYPGTSQTFSDPLKIALRIIRLHSTQGDPRMRSMFEDAMRKHPWNGSRKGPRVCEPPIPIGNRRHWGLIVFHEYIQIQAILDELSIP